MAVAAPAHQADQLVRFDELLPLLPGVLAALSESIAGPGFIFRHRTAVGTAFSTRSVWMRACIDRPNACRDHG
jgi:hypothetical protein